MADPRPGSAGRCRIWLRRLALLLLAGYFAFGLVFLGLRHLVLPAAPAYRGELAQLLSQSLGLAVHIEGLSGEWRGFRPRLQLRGVSIRDRDGRSALTLDRVDAEPAWTSLIFLSLRLHRLEIDSPDLFIQRKADGQILVAGLPVAMDGGKGELADWLLAQREVLIRNARLEWRDDVRQAEPLALDHLDFRLESRGSLHRFGLTAQPPARLAAAIDLRGELRGRDPAQPGQWRGELYAALDYADLGAWRQWVDYPLDVSGAGGLRAWLEVSEGQVVGATADFALRDARARLGKRLEPIPLAQAEGRLRYRAEGGLTELSGKRLSLRTQDGLVVAPTDFFLRMQDKPTGGGARGEFVANQLDLAVLSELAERLPLDEKLRARLATLSPQGSVAPLNLKWSMEAEALATYAVDARFVALGIRPLGAWPGFAGLSGRIEGNDRGGHFSLTGKDAALDLPQIFPEPRLNLAEVAAEGEWTHPGGVLEVNIAKLGFANQDARGSASGRYRASPDTPGEIDLQARLSDAHGAAVWRYVPSVVNKDARDWLQHSLVGGSARDTRLVLKGDLARFPFRDPREGVFRVTTQVADGVLEYAPGWPRITGIFGELVFEGPGMKVNAQKGRIFGAELRDVQVAIRDFEHDDVLGIRGTASGPTQDFLRFIAESPVAEMIHHFTDPFRAEGSGSLDLQLSLPLQKLEASRVKGDYQFAHNRIQPDPAFPVLMEASGRIGFTESQLQVKNAQARVLGEMATLSGGSRADGSVLLNVQGSASAAALRRELDLPLLDHLSGSAPWRGTISVPRKGGVEFALDSLLQGITSSLPEPLNKSAASSLPFHFEMLVGGSGDTLKLVAGSSFQAQFVRRREGGRMLISRGGIALNEAVRMPDKGVLVAASADRLDADAWRRALAGNASPAAGAARGDGFPLSGLALRAADLHMLGQNLSDVNLRAVMEEGGWQARLSSKEASGEFVWREQGRGRLQGRFKHLAMGGKEGRGEGQGDDEPLSELPGLDIVADSFVLRGRSLGRLELKAANRGDTWRLEQLSISNPDGSLSGEGQWRPGARQETRLNFKLDVNNVEKMLSRLGYPEAVRRGKAELAGDVSWRGAPTNLHLPSLAGRMQVHAENGQFAQLEPGVGRLLGVLNLQALPRRVTLDFRDVFSQGFAFDRISGSIVTKDGVLRTEDLEIIGPAARVFMSGEADAVRESQQLRVKVQPTLSESVAVGSAIAASGAINPAIGLAAYLVQKALRDPVEKLFSFEYAITGNWADPKVEKLAVRTPAPNP